MKTLGAKMIGLLVAAFILCSAFRADRKYLPAYGVPYRFVAALCGLYREVRLAVEADSVHW